MRATVRPPHTPWRPSLLLRWWCGAALLVLGLGVAWADPATPAEAELGAPSDAGLDAEVLPPHLLALQERIRQLQALIDGTLAIDVDPQTVLETPLDPASIALEIGRIEPSLKPLAKGKPEPLTQARLELDRARLAFFRRPQAERDAILERHAEQRQRAWEEADAAAEQISVPTQAELAAKERQRLLEQARLARSEAERRVSQEHARLMGVLGEQVDYERSLQQRRDDIVQRRQLILGWRRRGQETRESGSAVASDALYTDMARALRASLAELAAALTALDQAGAAVPTAGEDPLTRTPGSAELTDVTAVRAARAEVEDRTLTLSRDSEALAREDIAVWLEEADTLNRERLALLPFLSPALHEEVTGFTSAGWNQAVHEVRHLLLILRVHRVSVLAWWQGLRGSEQRLGGFGTLQNGMALAQGLAVLLLYAWWRRRAPALLVASMRRVRDRDHKLRLAKASRSERVLGFLARVHGPISDFLLVLALHRILPAPARAFLEVELLAIVLTWTLGGRLVVTTVDALFDRYSASPRLQSSAALRLRSLRFVGRVIIGFGLFLSLSARLVGRGTLFDWISVACALAAPLVFLILVRWWRPTVLARLEALARKDALSQWVLGHRRGITSVLAAAVGAVYLFTRGVLRVARSVVLQIDITRRFLAWLFRRELARREKEQRELAASLDPLSDGLLDSLGPEGPIGRWVDTDLDAQLTRLRAAVGTRTGRLVAVVGQRGMGKSAALQHLAATDPQRWPRLAVQSSGALELLAELREVLGLAEARSLPDLVRQASALPLDAVLLDDAERLVRPTMGGLDGFDALFSAIRKHSAGLSWVLTFDATIWQYLVQARGQHPLFDRIIHLEPWREHEIAELLEGRCQETHIEADFSQLLDHRHHLADESERREALQERRDGYYRLVWDYTAGNPGLALDVWRRSLGRRADGSLVVSMFPSLDTSELERLPDTTAFVYRAVIQLHPAREIDLVRATQLTANDVADALRYGVARGYLEVVEASAGASSSERRYRVSWTWLRPIQVFLQRKHLLVIA